MSNYTKYYQNELVRRIPLDYSKAAGKLGAKIKSIRKALGVSSTVAAQKMGLIDPFFYKIVEAGKAWPTEEWARRFVLWAWENKTFEKIKMAPLDLRKPKNRMGQKVEVTAEEYAAWKQKSKDLGVSMSVVAARAISAYLEGGTLITQVKQLIQESEALRVTSILENNRSLLTILNGDALVARYIHATVAPQSLVSVPKSEDHATQTLIKHDETAEGPYSDVLLPYAERLLEI